MRIKESDDELIAREIPYSSWLLSIFLTPFCAFAVYNFAEDLIKYPNYYFGLKESWYAIVIYILWQSVLFIIFLGCFLGFASLIFSPIITVRIKLSSQTIDIIHRKLFFKKHQRSYLHQVKKFSVVQENETKAEYFRVLELINNEKIYLETECNTDPANEIEKFNNFMKKTLQEINKAKKLQIITKAKTNLKK